MKTTLGNVVVWHLFLAIQGCAWLVCSNTKVSAQQDSTSPSSSRFSIAIHGGAGVEPDKLSQAQRQSYERALREALNTGAEILRAGGAAIDAVEKTIRVLEDEPLFNAGKGAVFNSEGQHELDAAIMDGKTHRAGAVAGVMTVKNPISLARLVMTETQHVLLIGSGAEAFANEMKSKPQIERVPNSYFSTEHRKQEWLKALEEQKKAKAAVVGKGTVGCVAFDRQGNLAAGTSTGGLTNKKWGRVGSVPVVGAGTFADNETCAISGTGIGEHFLLNSVGFHIHALMKFKGLSLEQAVTEVTDHVMPVDTAGIISIDKQGQVFLRCNTPGMARASMDTNGKVSVMLEAK